MTSKTAIDLQQDFANKIGFVGPISTILVLVVKSGSSDVLNCQNYTRHYVITKPKQNSDVATKVFCDEFGNVYADWKSFKADNRFDCGDIVAPLNGVYTFNNNGLVMLEHWEKRVDSNKCKTVREFQQDFGSTSASPESNSNSNVICVLVTASKKIEEAENSRKFTIHPVIRTNAVNQECETFVDEDGNSYNGWDSYKRENKLEDGILVAPTNGCYSFDSKKHVELEFWKTSLLNEVSRVIDSEPLTIREHHHNLALKVQSEVGMTMSTINVLVTEQTNMDDALNSREFSCHSVQRILNTTTGGQSFMDEYKTEYLSWNSFVSENRLPVGVMVAPRNGCYCFDANGDVELEVSVTPASIPKLTDHLPTIRNLQQHYASSNKYLKRETIFLHVLHTSIDQANVLDAIEFNDFLVKRIEYRATEIYYMDENENIYLSWELYLRNNDLPTGIMVAPANGEYTFDENGMVQLQIKIISRKTKKIRSVSEVQQDFAYASGYRKEIIWDLLRSDQRAILKEKIKELIPDQARGNNTIEETRRSIFRSVWAQRKYTNRNSLSAIIYVFVTDCERARDALNAVKYSCHPVFRTRKCIAEDDSSNCCMIFVDELGRVYQNWQAFLSHNYLPNGLMIAPRNGVYTIGDDGNVQLDVYKTPNKRGDRQLIEFTDKATSVVGFGAAAVPLAGLMVTVAPAVALCAGAVAATTAVYSACRSLYTLVDRQNHEQPINLSNSQARNAWLGFGAGVVGVGAVRATQAMTRAAAAGKEISMVTELVVNSVNISSIVLSGTGVFNGVLDIIIKYQDDEDVTGMDFVQLAASLVLFTHSVSNFKYASSLVSDTRQATIQDYRRSLSNRQRKIFDKMSKETIRIRGVNRGNIDIIRGANDMPSKQYLNDLYKVNKKLNQAKVRPAFGAAGEGVVLNNEVSVNTKILRNNLQNNQGPNVLQTVKEPIPAPHSESNVATNSKLFTNSINCQSSKSGIHFRLGSIILPNQVVIMLAKYGQRLYDIVQNEDSFEEIITLMANVFKEDIFNFLMELAQEFVEQELDELRRIIKMFISAETILYRILLHCKGKYHNQTYEYIRSKKTEILNDLRNYFLSCNPLSSNRPQKCDICNGSYRIVEL